MSKYNEWILNATGEKDKIEALPTEEEMKPLLGALDEARKKGGYGIAPEQSQAPQVPQNPEPGKSDVGKPVEPPNKSPLQKAFDIAKEGFKQGGPSIVDQAINEAKKKLFEDLF